MYRLTLTIIQWSGDILDLCKIDFTQIYAAYLAVMHGFPIKLASPKISDCRELGGARNIKHRLSFFVLRSNGDIEAIEYMKGLYHSL